MTVGLPVNRLINISASLSALGAQFANLSSVMIMGESDVIDTTTRIRTYTGGSTQIGIDFGSNSPEYLAAVAFFSQFGSNSPEYLAAVGFSSQVSQSQTIMIGKWAQSATAGRVIGGQLSTTAQALANFTAITTGALKLSVDGGAVTQVTGINLSTATALPGVATLINTAFTGASLNITCSWNGYQFVFKSQTTGAASAVTIPVATTSGVNLSTVLGMTALLGAYAVGGIVAESALTAVQIMDALPTPFYMLSTDASPDLVDADRIAISAYIESASNPHFYGFTRNDPNALNPAATSDIGYILTQTAPKRTFGQYSSTNLYASTSILALAATINYLGSNTAINFMYQSEPGVVAETINSTQAGSLDTKRYNYVANYANGAAILQNGTCFGAAYLDEQLGIDWLVNYIQTNIFNLLATIGTKIAQTDAGIHAIVNNIEASLAQAVTNGLLAPGTWTAAPFGQINTGTYLAKGYYIYAPPIATQASAGRAARTTPLIQIGAKFAGAVNTVNVALTFNR